MATPQENLARFQEIANRGLQDRLDPDKKARFDEAVSRGLIKLPQAQQMAKPLQIAPEASQPVQTQPAQQNFTLGQEAVGVGEGVLSKATGLIGSIPAGIYGLATAIDPFAPEGSAAERAAKVQEALTYQPRTEAGKAELQKTDVLEPALSKLQDLRESSGEGAMQATDSPFLSSIAYVLPDAILSLFALKGAPKGTPQQLAQQQATKQLSQQYSKLMTESDQAIAKLIIDKADDVSTATKKLSADNLVSKLSDGLPRIVNDKPAINAIKQGVSEKAVAIIKAMTKKERAQVQQMLGTAERALKSGTAEVLNRISDTVGKTLTERVAAVKKINRMAGSNVNKVAESTLRNQAVDSSSIAKVFNDGLAEMKISNTGGKLAFEGSSLETGVSGAASARNILKLMQSRINAAGTDAFKLHELKRFIDDQVKFGKTPAGAAGAAESTLKAVRAEINKVLGDNFPKYREVNAKYASTKAALDDFQSAAGPSIDVFGDFAETALGTKMRALTSNQAGRAKLIEAMAKLEDTLVNNGVKFKDRIIEQTIIANELETLLKLSPKTGFRSEIAGAVVDAAIGQPVAAAARAAKSATSKIKGASPEKALAALKELLKESK